MKTIKKQSLFRSIPVFRFRVATNIQKHVSFQVQGCYRYLETPQCLGLGLPPVFKRKGFLGFRVATLIQGIKSNPYLEAYQYLGLGLPPVFRSIPLFRFRVATSIQKHPNVQVQGCHQYLEEKDIWVQGCYLNLGYKKAFPIQKRTSIYVQGCYQYLEAHQCLGLGLLPVFGSTPVFGFRVATNISGIKETVLIQKHTSIQIQGCQHETTGLWNNARFRLVQGCVRPMYLKQ